MKPILTNKNKIYKIIQNTINTKNKNIKIKDNDQNIIFFQLGNQHFLIDFVIFDNEFFFMLIVWQIGFCYNCLFMSI